MVLKFKKAFTLAEVMICLVIISIVTAATLITVKPYDKYNGLLYQKAYTALDSAVYNTRLGLGVGQNFNNTVLVTPTSFCTYLTTWINATNSYCSYAKVVPNTVADSDFVTPTDGTTNQYLQFISTNGMRFYFSDLITVVGNDDVGGRPYSSSLRLVFIDLNGGSRPNTGIWSQNRMADIVAFAVTDRAIVIPIGYPEIDQRYISASYVSYNGKVSPTTTYYAAKYSAWEESTNAMEVKSFVTTKKIEPLFASTLIKIPPAAYPSGLTADNANGCGANVTFPLAIPSPCTVVIKESDS